jgi:hypothetical protein
MNLFIIPHINTEDIMYKSTLLLVFSCTANDFNNHGNSKQKLVPAMCRWLQNSSCSVYVWTFKIKGFGKDRNLWRLGNILSVEMWPQWPLTSVPGGQWSVSQLSRCTPSTLCGPRCWKDAPDRNWTLDHPVPSQVTKLTELSLHSIQCWARLMLSCWPTL